MNAGISFAPFSQSPPSAGASPTTANPVQDAIKLLSFRLPRNVGASPVAPGAIMGGPTALGPQLGNSIAEQWLKALFQGQPLPSLGGPSDQGGMPGGMPPNAGGSPFDMAAAQGLPSILSQGRPSSVPVNVTTTPPEDRRPLETPTPPSAPTDTYGGWLSNERGLGGGPRGFGG
jgi:hypothetical protein